MHVQKMVTYENGMLKLISQDKRIVDDRRPGSFLMSTAQHNTGVILVHVHCTIEHCTALYTYSHISGRRGTVVTQLMNYGCCTILQQR